MRLASAAGSGHTDLSCGSAAAGQAPAAGEDPRTGVASREEGLPLLPCCKLTCCRASVLAPESRAGSVALVASEVGEASREGSLLSATGDCC